MIARSFRRCLPLLLAGVAMPAGAGAQTSVAAAPDPDAAIGVPQDSGGDVVVTATRRDETVQSAPINISAVGGEQLRDLGLRDLRDVARAIPGVYIPDQGNRSGTPIVFRGLNATGLSSFDGNNSGGGTVATYVGEIPLYVDLRLNDMERIEFLLGPQGTLYGAGTLGGAIRYIPRRPQLGRIEGEVRADVWDYASSAGVSTDTGATVNLPLGDYFAFRGSIDLMNDTGFIDYPFAVQQVGVSNPNVDPANAAAYAANLRRLEDLNTDETLSARAALRFNPGSLIDVTATYYHQDQDTDGRQFSQARLGNFPVPIGRYENALRVAEPNSRETQLVAVEATLDLGFAALTSATGWSEYDEIGNRDQTDLLIGLEYGYEAFPSFTAFTEEVSRERVFSQEARLVSKFSGPLSFIVGGFYNLRRSHAVSSEFTPGFDVFNGGSRPDPLEYYSVDETRLREAAGYGELTFQITDAWQVTGGLRYYDYQLRTRSAVDFPLFNTVFGGAGPDEIVLDFQPGGQSDNGWLFKGNTSYRFSPTAQVYATFSQGYRIGNSNGVAPCPVPLPPNQIACGLPNELFYAPDKTNNYEIGLKSQFLDRRLTFNAALYWIDWSGPQVTSATQNGLIPVTINGSNARSRGLELFAQARLIDGLSLRATYSYVDAQLTDISPNLIQTLVPPGFNGTAVYIDGRSGDRLPGSPEHQGSVFLDYERPIGPTMRIGAAYGVYAQSDVLTRTGGRGGGLTLPGFDIHQAQVRLEGAGWKIALYAENIWNEFAETGVRGTPLFDQAAVNADGDPVYVRTFGTFVAPPRRIGLRIAWAF